MAVKNTQSRVTVMHFSSVYELMAYALDSGDTFKVLNNRHAFHSVGKSLTSDAQSWFGCESHTACRKLIETGNPDGARLVDSMLDKIAPHIPRAIDISRKRTRGDQGDSLDIHAVYRGDLSRAWEKVGRAFRPANAIVRIAVDLASYSTTSATALAWRGVAALALASALQRARYAVEILAGFCTENTADGQGYTVTVPLKARGEVGNTLKLAGTACLSGFGRYAILSAIARRGDDDGRRVSSTYGQPVALSQRMLPDSRVAQFVIPSTVLSQAAAEKWVTDTLKILQSVNINAE